MSYWTGSDFLDPIKEGNSRVKGKLFYMAVEPIEKDPAFVPCNLGGMIAVSHYLKVEMCWKQRQEALKQLEEITLERPTEYLRVLDILGGGCTVHRILINKYRENPVGKLDEWYLNAVNINNLLLFSRFHASGGLVNGSWYLTERSDLFEYYEDCDDSDGPVIFEGDYYCFAENHLKGTEADKLISFLSTWRDSRKNEEILFNLLLNKV